MAKNPNQPRIPRLLLRAVSVGTGVTLFGCGDVDRVPVVTPVGSLAAEAGPLGREAHDAGLTMDDAGRLMGKVAVDAGTVSDEAGPVGDFLEDAGPILGTAVARDAGSDA
jgi:hypothetical protein